MDEIMVEFFGELAPVFEWLFPLSFFIVIMPIIFRMVGLIVDGGGSSYSSSRSRYISSGNDFDDKKDEVVVEKLDEDDEYTCEYCGGHTRKRKCPYCGAPINVNYKRFVSEDNV